MINDGPAPCPTTVRRTARPLVGAGALARWHVGASVRRRGRVGTLVRLCVGASARARWHVGASARLHEGASVGARWHVGASVRRRGRVGTLARRCAKEDAACPLGTRHRRGMESVCVYLQSSPQSCGAVLLPHETHTHTHLMYYLTLCAMMTAMARERIRGGMFGLQRIGVLKGES